MDQNGFNPTQNKRISSSWRFSLKMSALTSALPKLQRRRGKQRLHDESCRARLWFSCACYIIAACPDSWFRVSRSRLIMSLYRGSVEQTWVWLTVESWVDSESKVFRLSHELIWIEKIGKHFESLVDLNQYLGIHLSHELNRFNSFWDTSLDDSNQFVGKTLESPR